MGQRFLKFGIGLVIGILLSYILFRGHDITSWMPNGRILVVIQKINPSDYSDKVKCQIDCFQIADEDMAALYVDGDVDFGASETHSEPRVYLIDYVNKNKETIQGKFAIYQDDSAELLEIKVLGQLKDCPC